MNVQNNSQTTNYALRGLPKVIVATIFSHLQLKDLAACFRLSKWFKDIGYENIIFQKEMVLLSIDKNKNDIRIVLKNKVSQLKKVSKIGQKILRHTPSENINYDVFNWTAKFELSSKFLNCFQAELLLKKLGHRTIEDLEKYANYAMGTWLGCKWLSVGLEYLGDGNITKATEVFYKIKDSNHKGSFAETVVRYLAKMNLRCEAEKLISDIDLKNDDFSPYFKEHYLDNCLDYLKK